MKKTLLAAALAVGFAGVAQAETSVTLYGIIDAGFGWHEEEGRVRNTTTGETRSTDRTRTGLHDGGNAGQSGSRWGLKGAEDLGNGLRAEFQLESGFNVTNGTQGQSNDKNDRLFGRAAWVGLASDSWGSLRFGRQTNIGSDFMLGMIDPFAGGFGLANGGDAFRAINTNRMDNTVKYVTPNYSGFQFGLAYSFNHAGAQEWTHDKRDNPNTKAISAGLRYANGPLGVALTYDQMKNSSYTGTRDTTVKQWNIGGAYDFEVVKLHAAFGQSRDGEFGGRATYGLDYVDGAGSWVDVGQNIDVFDEGFKSNSYLVGLTAPVGAGKLMASWTMVDPRSKPDRLDGVDWSMKKQHTYALGYQYPLSKRTNVYAYGAYKDNVGFNDGQEATSIAVGLRHQF